MLESAVVCLALMIHNEARGEELVGQIAVAHVALNRVRGNQAKVCAAVKKPKQFSVAPKLPRTVAGRDALLSARAAIALHRLGLDYAKGATHFHSGKAPWWAAKLDFRGTIGGHHFYFERMRH